MQSEALLGRILQLDDSRAEDSWSSEGLLDDDTESEQEEVFSEPTPQKDFRGHAFPILVHNTGAAQLKVYSLGRIVHDRDAFHTPKHIWPVGYVCTRRHFSMRNPQRTVTYTCEILDGGDMPSVRALFFLPSSGAILTLSWHAHASQFRITASDDLDNPIIASSSSAAWKGASCTHRLRCPSASRAPLCQPCSSKSTAKSTALRAAPTRRAPTSLALMIPSCAHLF